MILRFFVYLIKTQTICLFVCLCDKATRWFVLTWRVRLQGVALHEFDEDEDDGDGDQKFIFTQYSRPHSGEMYRPATMYDMTCTTMKKSTERIRKQRSPLFYFTSLYVDEWRRHLVRITILWRNENVEKERAQTERSRKRWSLVPNQLAGLCNITLQTTHDIVEAFPVGGIHNVCSCSWSHQTALTLRARTQQRCRFVAFRSETFVTAVETNQVVGVAALTRPG